MVTNASFGWLLAVMPLVLAVVGLIGCVGYGIVGMFHVSVLGRVVLGLWVEPDGLGGVVGAASVAGVR